MGRAGDVGGLGCGGREGCLIWGGCWDRLELRLWHGCCGTLCYKVYSQSDLQSSAIVRYCRPPTALGGSTPLSFCSFMIG